MSAFLGEIHYWLYKKILQEEKFLEEILIAAKNKGIDEKSLKQEGEQIYGASTKGDLEDLIDKDNIHGWLQNKIFSVESRLALAVTHLINNKNMTKEEINQVFVTNAKKLAISLNLKNVSPEKMYTIIFDYLLAGMPCDRVNIIEKSSDECIKWSNSINIHKQYWIGVNGDVENFNYFIQSWIISLIKESNVNLCYKKIGNTNIIERVM